MNYDYDLETGTMRLAPTARVSWWTRLFDRRRKRRRAITAAQGRQMLAFAATGDTGTERL